jgi:hypothetical protein
VERVIIREACRIEHRYGPEYVLDPYPATNVSSLSSTIYTVPSPAYQFTPETIERERGLSINNCRLLLLRSELLGKKKKLIILRTSDITNEKLLTTKN